MKYAALIIVTYFLFFPSFSYYGSAKGALTLSPSEVVFSCPGDQLTLTCTNTNTMFLQWRIISFQGSPSRLVPSEGVAQELESLIVNSITFSILRISARGVMPLVSTLVVNNVTIGLNSTAVSCSAVARDGQTLATVEINIYVIATAPQVAVPVILSEYFGRESVTILLELMSENGGSLNHSIFVVPYYTPVIQLRNASIHLRIPYNVLSNVSIVTTQCGRNSTPTIIQFKYAKCGHPLEPGLNKSIKINGYTEPATEGTTLHFICLSGLTLIGPNSTTCIENGEWEPDPREVNCKVNCGDPNFKCNIKSNYNSTLDGSSLSFWCEDGLLPSGIFSAVCNRNASWTPNPSQHVCATPQSANCGAPTPPQYGDIVPYTSTVEEARVEIICHVSHTEKSKTTICNQDGSWEPNPVEICTVAPVLSQDALIPVISSISSFILSSLLFFTIGCICQYSIQKRKHSIVVENEANTQQSHSRSDAAVIYEDIQLDHQSKENVELRQNVAYISA